MPASVCATANERDTHVVQGVLTGFSAALAREVLAPTEFVGNCAYRLARIAQTCTPEIAAAAQMSAGGLPNLWALISGDAGARALVLCFPGRGPRSADTPFPHPEAGVLGLVGAHFGAALRLRELAWPGADDPGTEAVLSPSGKVLHATGAAKTAHSRGSLARAVLASERARRRSRTVSHGEALREWTALVNGQWTILETVERDGKRLVLARRNRIRGADLLDLSDDERDVTWLASLGHSYKYIAYELGVPIGTVAGRLRRAMRKLRVTSRHDLLRKLGR